MIKDSLENKMAGRAEGPRDPRVVEGSARLWEGKGMCHNPL